MAEIENQVAVDLPDKLRENTPKFFEKSVIKQRTIGHAKYPFQARHHDRNSGFSKSARDDAKQGKVILIDGPQLATLMIRYNVGIQTRQILEIVGIDEDFFE